MESQEHISENGNLASYRLGQVEREVVSLGVKLDQVITNTNELPLLQFRVQSLEKSRAVVLAAITALTVSFIGATVTYILTNLG